MYLIDWHNMARVRRFIPSRVRIGASRGHAYNAGDLRRQLDQLNKNFVDFANHMRVQSANILEEALRPAFDLSQVYVPQDTGRLKDSGYLETEVTPNGARASLGYAPGGNPYYALYVHEIPTLHREPTRWKYLQSAIEETQGQVQETLRLLVQEASGVGGA